VREGVTSWIFLCVNSDVTKSYLGVDEAPLGSKMQDTGLLEEFWML